MGKKLGIPVYDQELISKAAEQSGFSKELFAKSDEKRNLLALSSFIVDVGRFGSADNYVSDNQLFVIQSNVIRSIADKGSAISSAVAQITSSVTVRVLTSSYPLLTKSASSESQSVWALPQSRRSH